MNTSTAPDPTLVTYDTEPAKYRHWTLITDGGPIARLVLDIQEDGGIRSGYKLKLNSYDLGVDIELNDAAQRLRFEHPEVKCVVKSGGRFFALRSVDMFNLLGFGGDDGIQKT